MKIKSFNPTKKLLLILLITIFLITSISAISILWEDPASVGYSTGIFDYNQDGTANEPLFGEANNDLRAYYPNGTLLWETTFTTFGQIWDIETYDTGTGYQDGIVIGANAYIHYVYRNGTEKCRSENIGGAYAVIEMGDFDGDGNATEVVGSGNDLFVFNSSCSQLWNATGGAVNSKEVRVADINEDGDDEVVAMSDNHVYVYYNNGTQMLDLNATESGLTNLQAIALADITSDDGMEIIVSGRFTAMIAYNSSGSVLWNHTDNSMGVGSYDLAEVEVGTFGGETSIVFLGDEYHSNPLVLVRNGSGDDVWNQSITNGDGMLSLIVGDIDGDGLDDIAFHDGTLGNSQLWIFNNSFSNIQNVSMPQNYVGNIWGDGAMTLADVTGDLMNDLIVGGDINATVLAGNDTFVPSITITYPLNQSYSENVSEIRYTYAEATPDSCWYSKDGGATNSTPIAMGTNFTGVTSDYDSNTWHLWCNDSNNYVAYDNVTFWKNLDVTDPVLTIISPIEQTYTVSSVDFNVSVNENSSACWFNVDGGTNTTMTNINNTYFNYTNSSMPDKNYNATFWCNDTTGNTGTKPTIYFAVDTSPPAVSLEYPGNFDHVDANLVVFNYTPTGATLDTCEFYGNWSGGWHLNQSDSSPVNASVNDFNVTLPEGTYFWNIKCNNTIGTIDWSAQGNQTFTVDTTYPLVDIEGISTTQGSQTITFDYNITDDNIDTCFYSILNSTGGIDGLNNNISMTCGNNSKSATTTAFSNYTLVIYGRDLAGNENSTNQSFITEPAPPAEGGVGGGISEVRRIPATNFSVYSRALGDKLDLVLAKDSVRPRKTTFIFVNQDIETVDVDLSCDVDEDELIEKGFNMCDYVSFETTNLTLSTSEVENTIGILEVMTPPNSSFGDVYNFNIVATSKQGEVELFSKLSVSARVPIWAIIFKWSYIPFQNVDLQPEEKSAYPVWTLSLLLAFILFAFIFFIMRKRLPTTGFIIGLILGLASFVGLLFVL